MLCPSHLVFESVATNSGQVGDILVVWEVPFLSFVDSQSFLSLPSSLLVISFLLATCLAPGLQVTEWQILQELSEEQEQHGEKPETGAVGATCEKESSTLRCFQKRVQKRAPHLAGNIVQLSMDAPKPQARSELLILDRTCRKNCSCSGCSKPKQPPFSGFNGYIRESAPGRNLF